MAAIAIFQRNCSTIEFKKQSKPILTGFGCFFIKCRVQKTSETFDVILLGIDLIAESLAQKRKYVRLIMDKTNISLYNC